MTPDVYSPKDSYSGQMAVLSLKKLRIFLFFVSITEASPPPKNFTTSQIPSPSANTNSIPIHTVGADTNTNSIRIRSVG